MGAEMGKVRRRGNRLLGIAAGGMLVLALAACSSSVAKDQVASTIAEQLQKQSVAVDSNTVTCPADLKAEVGQSIRCAFTTGGQPVDAIAKVSAVNGSTVNYDITTEARPVAKALLETTVGKQVGQQVGVTVDKTDCTADLLPEVGKSVNCTLTGGGDTATFKVTVTAVNGGQVNFGIEKA